MDTSDFLKQDFSESYNQIRHYDNIILDSFKFIFSIYIALIGGAISLLNIDLKIDLMFLIKTLIIISILFCVFILYYIIEQRQYFVKTARYINEIRHFYLNDNQLGFLNESKFYVNRLKPDYFNLRSSHIILTVIISVLNAFSFGLLFFVFNYHEIYKIFIVSTSVLMIHLIIIYLLLRNK